MVQVWISNLRVAEIKLLALETRPIVSTENVSFVLKRVAIDLHTLLSFSDNSDLIACMVVSKDGCQAQRFLAVDVYQMSLVEPETKRLGWGVVKFAGLLQVSRITTFLVVELATYCCIHISLPHFVSHFNRTCRCQALRTTAGPWTSSFISPAPTHTPSLCPSCRPTSSLPTTSAASLQSRG